MNKFTKALILSLVIAAPVAISLPVTEAEAAVATVATETNTPTVVSHTAKYEVAYYHRRPVRHHRRVVRRYHRVVRHHR